MTQHLKPRSATVVLYQGDDMDRLAQLKRAADIASNVAEANAGTARFGDDDTSVATAQREYDQAVDEAAGRALSVEIRSIGRRRFRDLLADHPPRMVDGKPDEDGVSVQVEHDEDAGYGVNTETFPEALLCFRDFDTVTIASPEFATSADVKRFLDDEISDGDFDQLWLAAYFLNRSPSADPKVAGYGSGSLSTDAT